MRDLHLRLGDDERGEASTALAEHYARGRLSPDEHSERLDQVWAARTRADLQPIFRDLPSLTPAYHAGQQTRGWHRGLPTPLVVVLVALLALTVLTHLPLVLLGLLVWAFVRSRHRGRRAVRGHTLT